ncbi:MAG: hypothetical protein COA71_00015 [SAR86 cluster bacterium]|uniref:Tetratricopeptide repeat protein n=1 Tax=SAR86 cluster bacterium TaxID=2030880 RepID=A0A2A5CHP8_9GAMM|nr:MAG: hypothetical protein COA71_00015 [SAR86 cluster bacterium]
MKGCDKWTEVLIRGNTEYSLNYYGNAILLFQQALDLARFKFNLTAKLSYDRAISQVVICHFSLADCYIAIDQIERAADFYILAQKFLLQIPENSTIEVNIVNNATQHAVHHVNDMWLEFIRKYRENISYDHLKQFYKQNTLLHSQKEKLCIYH